MLQAFSSPASTSAFGPALRPAMAVSRRDPTRFCQGGVHSIELFWPWHRNTCFLLAMAMAGRCFRAMGVGRQHHRKTFCVGWSIKGEGYEICCCKLSVAQHLLLPLGLRFVLLWLSYEGTPPESLKVGHTIEHVFWQWHCGCW